MTIFKVKDVAEIINGYAFPAEQFNSDYKGLPIIRIRDILRGFSETYYSGEYSNEYIVNNGDLLIGMDGEFNIQTWQGGKALLNQRVCKIKVKEDISNHIFLKYCLALLLKKIEENTPFVTVKHLSSESLKNEEIFLPPLEEQKRIAEILSKCDNIRRIRKYSLQVSDTYLQSVFLEMFGDFNHNSKKWDYQSFDDVCAIDAEMVNPKEKPYCNYLHIGGANIESVTGNLLDLKTAKEDGLISSKFLINEEHLIFSKIRPKLRKISYPKIKALCSADIYPIRIRDKDKSNIYYLLFYLKSEFFSKIVSELAESRTNIPKVNREELAEQFIPIPPLSLQEKFAKIVKKFESYRNQQQEAQRQANHLFQTLLHQAFTGKL